MRCSFCAERDLKREGCRPGCPSGGARACRSSAKAVDWAQRALAAAVPLQETMTVSAIKVALTSDFICPWCLIGERRLQAAVARLPQDVAVEVRWLPFQLNPTMPKAGIDRRAYRTAKFGSWKHSQALDAEVAA